MPILYTVADINPATLNLTGNHSVLIRGHSTAQASMDFAGVVVDLDMCLIQNGEERVWGTEATFANVTSNKFEFHCEDDQYNHINETVTVPMVEYINLTCHAADSKPDATGDVTLVCSGDYFNDSFGAYQNTLSVKYRYRVKGGTWSGYSIMTATAYGNTYSAFANLSGLNYKLAYDFEFIASDRLMTASSSSMNVVSVPVFHWGENDVVFEVPVTFKDGVPDLTIDDYLHIGDGHGVIGKNGDELAISAYRLNLISDNILHNGSPAAFAQYGTWTPSLSCTGVYWSNSGWYVKSGKVVTVGFHIKMSCDPGYQNNSITIYGLPYTPAIAAAGGGMCSGAYVSGGFNFQCFVAETGGYISTRVQACNNTSSANLSTSASGCNYPTGSDELTISGTITYMTA